MSGMGWEWNEWNELKMYIVIYTSRAITTN